jgi:stage II sporulation protein AA (anti-sigma F factor antagonist)
MGVEVEVTKRGDVVVLGPKGSVNTESAPKFEQMLVAQLNAGEKLLVVDFSGVDYISSAGLRVLLMTAKRLKVRGGAIALCAMSPTVARVFALCGFERDFTIVESREKALARVAGAAAQPTPAPRVPAVVPEPAPAPKESAPAPPAAASRPPARPPEPQAAAGDDPDGSQVASQLTRAVVRALSVDIRPASTAPSKSAPAAAGSSGAGIKASPELVSRVARALAQSGRYGE